MDTHIASIQIIIAEVGPPYEFRVYDQISDDLEAFDKLAHKPGSPKHRHRFVCDGLEERR